MANYRWWRDPTNPNIKGSVQKPVQKPVQQHVQHVLEQMPVQQLKQIEKQRPLRPFDIEAVYEYMSPESLKIYNFVKTIVEEYPKQFMPKHIQDLKKSKKIMDRVKYNEIRIQILTTIFFRDRKLYNRYIQLERQLLTMPNSTDYAVRYELKDILKNIKNIKPQNENEKKELENFYKQVKRDYKMLVGEVYKQDYRGELGYLPYSVKMFGYKKSKKSKSKRKNKNKKSKVFTK